MFDHVDIAVSDLDASRRFYSLALGEPDSAEEWVEFGDFGITAADGEHRPTRRLHVGFGAPDRAAVDAWWRKMVDGGYESDGEPGPRPVYGPDYYGGFVLDPDGNSIELCHHDSVVPGMDHLWLRTRDLGEARRFYETVAPVVGIRLTHSSAERVQFTDGRGSFSFVAGDEPTEHVHLAFGVTGVEPVAAFHRLATAAGFADNGGPGERPEYHAGYHGSFVFDGDGHNVEAVFHDRR